MCAAIRTKVEELKKKMNIAPAYQGKIPLYITGHSLGGALASLFYYRLRKGKDLDDVCDVRDTYVYGCPGVGDTDFAMGYASYSSLSSNVTPPSSSHAGINVCQGYMCSLQFDAHVVEGCQ